MLTALMTLLATVSSIFRSRAALELENLALRHQIGVLPRAAAKRLKLTSADHLLWICLSRLWRGWRSALTIVKFDEHGLGIFGPFSDSPWTRCSTDTTPFNYMF
jgi:hypothetical protein